jgi:hypothetical protein
MPRTALAVVVALSLAAAGRAAGPYDDLLKYSSANTNAVALIDVKGAVNSPLARAEKWNEKGQPDNRGGLGFVPRDAELVAIFSEVNFSTLVLDFQVGVVKVRNTPTMPELAARGGGTPDEIAGRLSLLSPRNVYYTTLSGTQLAAVYPADRQYTARWLKAVQAKKTGQLSPYLRKAADAAGANTVTIALDLEDVVDKTLLKLTLPASPAVAKAKTADVGLLATFLSQIKGMTFAAKVTDKITGSISVEFAGDPSMFKRTLPDLIRELLEGQGVAIAGFEGWEVKFTDTTMTLSGPLSTTDLKNVVSLFAFPSPPGEVDPMVKGNEPSVPMTRRYLAAVDTIVNDLKKTKESPNYEKTATWHEKAAAQIEQLNRRGVDPVAADAAFETAKRLRAIGQSLRGVPIDAKALQSQQYYYSRPSVSMMGGWWGWRPIYNGQQVDTNIPQIQAEIAKVVAADQKLRTQTWSDIERILVGARSKLAEKYPGF